MLGFRGTTSAHCLRVLLGFLILAFAESAKVFGPDQDVLLSLTALWKSQNLDWTAGADCSTLTGITCDEEGHVTALHLSDNNLQASIPLYIRNLTRLTQLVINNGSLTGSIPSTIGDLVNLTDLELAKNSLVGAIPASVANLKELTVLRLFNNHLNGTIPAGIGNLTQLVDLELYSNALTGPIPDSIESLLQLQTLKLYDNNLTGAIPEGIGALRALTNISLSQNRLEGGIPASLEALSNLTELIVYDNLLSGEIPNGLGNLVSLKNLQLDRNLFTGTIPESIGNLVNLVYLKIDENRLNGSIPSSMENLVNLVFLVLRNNSLSGSIPSGIGNFKSMTILWLENNLLSGPIPPTLGGLGSMQDISMKNNRLSGELPSFAGLPLLQSFDVANNELTGPVPAGFFNSSKLSFLDLTGNFFTGTPLPASTAAAANGLVYTSGNCFAAQIDLSANGSAQAVERCQAFCKADEEEHPCGGPFGGTCSLSGTSGAASCTCLPSITAYNGTCLVVNAPPPPPPLRPPPPPLPPAPPGLPKKSTSVLPVVGGVVGGVVALLVAGCVLWACARSKQQRRKEGTSFAKDMEDMALKSLSKRQILAATKNFCPDRIIGKGGYGTVYLANAPDGTPWAVKRVNKVSQETLPVFENEVKLIASVRHNNLVALLGYYSSREEQILVYEYVTNGTLQDHLLLQHADSERRGPLTFQQRLEIAAGTARAITYLHCFAKEPIIHRDIKSSNILIDHDFQAKLADFGLSKRVRKWEADSMLLSDTAEVTNEVYRIVGTPGYIDPEYNRTLRVTTKSDVFSFGVVLLELITGKPAVMNDDVRGEPIALVRWAMPFIVENKLKAIVDPLLNSNYPREKLKVMASVAKMCVATVGKDRPSMAQVTRYLEAAQGSTLHFELTGPGSEEQNSLDLSFPELGLQDLWVEASSGSSSGIMRPPVSQALGPR